MDDLKFPIIKGPQREPRILSMEEYIEFCQFNWENLVDKEAYREWKKVMAIDAPFRIK